jgi:hypothetical protein
LAASRFRGKIVNIPRWSEDRELTNSIVSYLNEEILKTPKLRAIYYAPPRNGITTKWIARTKNRVGIEVCVTSWNSSSRSRLKSSESSAA